MSFYQVNIYSIYSQSPLTGRFTVDVASEIFPYLVVVIGLENVLVVTKSVVSTPVHLEVKLRVAQGQSRLHSDVKLLIVRCLSSYDL